MKVKEQVMRWVFAETAAFSIAAVALICVFLFLNGLPFFTKYDLGAFLSGTTWKPANNIFGILPMIVGSLYVTAAHCSSARRSASSREFIWRASARFACAKSSSR